jgi:hypothetical protein
VVFLAQILHAANEFAGPPSWRRSSVIVVDTHHDHALSLGGRETFTRLEAHIDFLFKS